MQKIENSAIKKTRDKLKLPKEKYLFGITSFCVNFSHNFIVENGTPNEFINNLELRTKPLVVMVCDSASNVIAIVEDKTVYPNFNKELSKDHFYIPYFQEIEPEYIFEYIAFQTRYQIYFCYKQGNITIVYLSDDGEKIISYPLSEQNGWRWFNIEARDWSVYQN